MLKVQCMNYCFQVHLSETFHIGLNHLFVSHSLTPSPGWTFCLHLSTAQIGPYKRQAHNWVVDWVSVGAAMLSVLNRSNCQPGQQNKRGGFSKNMRNSLLIVQWVEKILSCLAYAHIGHFVCMANAIKPYDYVLASTKNREYVCYSFHI